ncbi:alkaline phosphatase PafA [Pontibacter sp. SGAir0037]|uniref:alkaline phosphatase PafA n=1 Tax=Pontibacter sp. SGAir0037 TaxID=2571030 RepID=UPI0010CD2E7F|nr:alkaline phosphatase PafA [Pontibacter sp. SGAir0037]QCR24198.1 alkaline phosphatase family protein [Pontibacter sp. SGAir0037]
MEPQKRILSNNFIKSILIGVIATFASCTGSANTASSSGPVAENSSSQLKKESPLARPKLVVGIVVDQMRYDYLFRYWDKYGSGGFRRLVAEGYNFKNAHYNYVPTYTGPGHASVYTGTTPAVNGIVGNNWYNRELKASVYCTDDATVQTVGSTNQEVGKMSPANLLTTTITDQLRLATNKQSKVIGVALKDRGAILPAGHMANGAYWFDGKSGNWVTSTFYMPSLPGWVEEFNNQKYPDQHLSQPWNTLLPIDQYTESTADNTPYESAFRGEDQPVFPHNLPSLRGKDYELLRSVPAGNTFTFDFGRAAIEGEKLGQNGQTDFLALSLSSPDYVGHAFGPNSVEVEDVYLRLDQELEKFLTYLDETIGTENVLVFLTADHGAAHVPAFLTDNKVPAGVFNARELTKSLEEYLTKEYGQGKWVEYTINMQVYLNHNLIREKKLNLREMQEKVANYVLQFKGVSKAVVAADVHSSDWTDGTMGKVSRGHNLKRSGDVIVLLEPAWFDGAGTKGTTHGSYGSHDTHIPMVYYGWKVKSGESSTEVHVEDIAPTIASWLYIMEPNGATGKPLQELMK